MDWFDKIAGNISGGLAGGFLAMLINHIAMENVFKGNVGWLSARQIAQCYRSWNQACMIYAWQYIEKHKILFALAQIGFLIGFGTLGLGILSAIPALTATINSISLYISIACAVFCVLGLYLIAISSIVNYDDGETIEYEDEPVLISIDPKEPVNGYTYCPEDRLILTSNDESIPQPSRVAQLGEAYTRLRLWVKHLEKMIQKDQWMLSRSLNQEMDRTQDRLLQIEQRLFEIGAVESNLNCKELSYWVLTRFYEYHFKKNKNKILDVSPRKQKSCLKQMQKQSDEIGSGIITACEKSEELQYLTMFQQENLEKALQILIRQVHDIKRMDAYISDKSYEQWILRQDEKVKQCQNLLTKRKKYLEHSLEYDKKE